MNKHLWKQMGDLGILGVTAPRKMILLIVLIAQKNMEDLDLDILTTLFVWKKLAEPLEASVG